VLRLGLATPFFWKTCHAHETVKLLVKRHQIPGGTLTRSLSAVALEREFLRLPAPIRYEQRVHRAPSRCNAVHAGALQHVTPCDRTDRCQRQPQTQTPLVAVFQVAVLLHRPRSSISSSEPTRRPLFYFFPLVRLDIRHGRRRCVSLYLPKDDSLILTVFKAGFSSLRCSWLQGYCSPWFSSCVFVLYHTQPVRLSALVLHVDHHVLRPGV
jgi:hypothetical protein